MVSYVVVVGVGVVVNGDVVGVGCGEVEVFVVGVLGG